MGRSKKAVAARNKPSTGQGRSGAVRRKFNKDTRTKTQLRFLLPQVGFDWQFINIRRPVPDLKKDFVFRLQDACADACDDEDYPFRVAMGGIIARAMELELEDDVADVEPQELWKKVQDSFEEGDLATHPSITPEVLHAFVAYAIEAREFFQQNEDNDTSVPLGTSDMVGPVDNFISKLEIDDMGTYRDAYFVRPQEHRWKLGTHASHAETDNDKDGLNEDDADSGDDAEDIPGQDVEEKEQALSTEIEMGDETDTGEWVEESHGYDVECAVSEDEEMGDAEEELQQGDEGVEVEGDAMEGVEAEALELGVRATMTLNFRPRSG